MERHMILCSFYCPSSRGTANVSLFCSRKTIGAAVASVRTFLTTPRQRIAAPKMTPREHSIHRTIPYPPRILRSYHISLILKSASLYSQAKIHSRLKHYTIKAPSIAGATHQSPFLLSALSRRDGSSLHRTGLCHLVHVR